MPHPVLNVLIPIGLAMTPIALGQGDPQVSVETNAARTETAYRIDSGSCRIKWLLDHSPMNKGIMLQRSACTLSIRQQLPLFKKILEKVMLNPSNAQFVPEASLGMICRRSYRLPGLSPSV